MILKIVLKRVTPKEKEANHNKIYLAKDYLYNMKDYLLYINDKQIKLSKKESEILIILYKNFEKVVSSDEIKNSIWGNKDIASSTLRDTILRLRRKAPLLKIENISGVGYSLKNNYIK